MSTQLYDVCLPTCVMSLQLYDVCLLVCCLLNGVMSAHLYDVYSSVWCLLTCMMFTQLHDLPTYAMSALLYVCLPLWCPLTCLMAAQLYDNLPTLMMSSLTPLAYFLFCEMIRKWNFDCSFVLQIDIKQNFANFLFLKRAKFCEISSVSRRFIILRNNILGE